MLQTKQKLSKKHKNDRVIGNALGDAVISFMRGGK